MRQTPVLLLGYNRVDKMRGLIGALRVSAPKLVVVVIDGPKPANPDDEAKVQAVRDAVSAIDWTKDVVLRFRPVNIGLRASVSEAVGWATKEYGQVIVIEDDVLPGPHFVAYAEHMLDQYRDDDRVMHISGYNVVPQQQLGNASAHNRLSRYPESFAWATWDRAWAYYDDELSWPRDRSLAELAAITGSRSAAIRWRFNFLDAQAGRISTWAYRWIASMWSRGGVCLNPNVNLVTYVGQEGGTHTFTKPPWTELPLYEGPLEPLLARDATLDSVADRWVSRVVFGGTPYGALRGMLVSVALHVRKQNRARRSVRATRR